MPEENSTPSKEAETVAERLLSQMSAIATGVNSLLMLHAHNAIAADNQDAAAHCMSAVTHMVRVFNGQEAADELMNTLTEGLYSDLKQMIDSGIPPEAAVAKVKGEIDDDTN